MPLLLALLILIILAVVISLTMSLVHMVFMLIVAGIIGMLADAIVPGRLPFGWAGAIVAGLLGSWLGAYLVGPIGPAPFGIPVISALIGTVVLALLFDVAYTLLARGRK